MDALKQMRRKTLWVGPLLAALLLAGCAGIEPYQPRNYRQDGLESGLISGSEGEFVIYSGPAKPAADSEAGKNPDENANDEEQKNTK